MLLEFNFIVWTKLCFKFKVSFQLKSNLRLGFDSFDCVNFRFNNKLIGVINFIVGKQILKKEISIYRNVIYGEKNEFTDK